MITAHLALQPRLGQSPITHHGRRRHFEHRGCFLYRQPTEKTHLDDAALPLVEFRQRLQGFVERDEVGSTLVCHDKPLVEGDPGCVPSSLLVMPCTRVVYEDAPHDASGHGEEMRAIVPRHGFRINQPEIRLVDERCGLQAVIRTLMPDVPLRDSMQLCVYERNQSLQGILVALSPFKKQPGDFRGIVWNVVSLGPFSAFEAFKCISRYIDGSGHDMTNRARTFATSATLRGR